MTACVVDASVVAAAFFQEEHSNAARALVTSGRQLHAPDLILPEVANVIWKRCRRKEIDANEATELLSDVLSLPLLLTSSVDLTESALEIAVASNRTVYDSLYLVLALATGCEMATADRRLVNALSQTAFGAHVKWINDCRQ